MIFHYFMSFISCYISGIIIYLIAPLYQDTATGGRSGIIRVGLDPRWYGSEYERAVPAIEASSSTIIPERLSRQEAADNARRVL